MAMGASKPHRISGFTFTSSTNGIQGILVTATGVVSDWRIDHNTFSNFSGASSPEAIAINMLVNEQWCYGVIDNNTFSTSSAYNFRGINVNGANPYGTAGTWPASPKGTANVSLYVEDNVFNFGSLSNVGNGCIDSNSGASYVFRHNTVTNCNVIEHGFCNSSGTASVEIYNNTFACTAGEYTDCQRYVHMQGSGEAIIIDNTFTGSTGKHEYTIEGTHYRSATTAASGCSATFGRCDGSSSWSVSNDGGGTYGYPCFHQPGRDTSANLSPWYITKNTWTDTGAAVSLGVDNPWGVSNPSVADHVAANRDYYNSASGIQVSSSSPFNGTTGAGWGTLANRPTTCTTGSESGGGVGYWATDTSTLYRCSATNTWTTQYQPYTYPHPLQGAVVATSSFSGIIIQGGIIR